jgi:hypothetical protein
MSFFSPSLLTFVSYLAGITGALAQIGMSLYLADGIKRTLAVE